MRITEVDKMVIPAELLNAQKSKGHRETEKADRQMLDLYNRNARFKAYVDRCCKQDKRSVNDMLSLALVREVGKVILEDEAEEAGRVPAANSTYAPMGECV